MLQIRAHLLVTESLKLAHLIKHGARGEAALPHNSEPHTLSAWSAASVSSCTCLFICASIIRRVITTQRQRWIFAKSTAAVNSVALCFMISARSNLPFIFVFPLALAKLHGIYPNYANLERKVFSHHSALIAIHLQL